MSKEKKARRINITRHHCERMLSIHIIIFYGLPHGVMLYSQWRFINRGKKCVPQNISLKLEEISLIALTAAATFAILDTYLPAMSVGVHQGAAFGIGANLVGFPGGL